MGVAEELFNVTDKKPYFPVQDSPQSDTEILSFKYDTILFFTTVK
jgi:hypothetical protein